MKYRAEIIVLSLLAVWLFLMVFIPHQMKPMKLIRAIYKQAGYVF
jgi:hypothetical protein